MFYIQAKHDNVKIKWTLKNLKTTPDNKTKKITKNEYKNHQMKKTSTSRYVQVRNSLQRNRKTLLLPKNLLILISILIPRKKG